LLPPPHGRVPCAWLGIGAQQPSGVTNSGDGQPLPCNPGDGAYVAASCFTKQAGGSDPKICRDPKESPPLVSSSPPSTSNTRDRATACTLGIVAHAGCSKGASNICGTDTLPRANVPWMGCTSLSAHPLPSPNSNGRLCRGSSKHPDLTSMDMLGGKPPNVRLHCMPIRLRWSHDTIQNTYNIYICLDAIGVPYNGAPNTKAGSVC
jgi:hypothetical protein